MVSNKNTQIKHTVYVLGLLRKIKFYSSLSGSSCDLGQCLTYDLESF